MARIKISRIVGRTTYYDAVMEFPPRYKPRDKAEKFSIGKDLNKTVRNKLEETLSQLEQHNAGLSEVMDRSLSKKIQGLSPAVSRASGLSNTAIKKYGLHRITNEQVDRKH